MNKVYETQPVNVSKRELPILVREVYKPFQHAVKNRKLTCQVHFASSVPSEFFMDKKVYKEIIFNLVQNAVKFNKYGGSIMTSIVYDETSQKLVTTVEDKGEGISKILLN